MAEVARQVDDRDVRVARLPAAKELERVVRRTVDDEDELVVVAAEFLARLPTPVR